MLHRNKANVKMSYILYMTSDGAVAPGGLRVRFGEVEARGIALTPAGRDIVDPLPPDPAAWAEAVPRCCAAGDQEARLVELMREAEEHLDDAAHAKVTRLMCELTAFNIMQFVYEMQMSRATAFRG